MKKAIAICRVQDGESSANWTEEDCKTRHTKFKRIISFKVHYIL